MTMESIEIITPADRRRGIATLTLAFATDPVMRWAWPDQDRYLTYWPRIAEAFGGRAFDHGTAHGLGDGLAVALWLPFGAGPDEETFMELVGESISPTPSATSPACSSRWINSTPRPTTGTCR